MRPFQAADFAAFERFASKSCLLLFATGAEKGSFQAFQTVRKPPAPDRRKSQKTSLNPSEKIANPVCYCVCYGYFVFPWLWFFTPKTREKPQYLVVFRLELLTGFEPVTSSLPRTCSTCWAIAAYGIFCRFWRDSATLSALPVIPYQGCALPPEPQQRFCQCSIIILNKAKYVKRNEQQNKKSKK